MNEPKKTETLTLAAAMDVLAREIQCPDGVATSAIAEAAHRLRELEWEIAELLRSGDEIEPYAREHASGMSEQLAERWRMLAAQGRINHARAESIIAAREKTIERLHEKIEKLTVALKDAISTYDPNREVTLVSAERQEAWNAALLW